jgi:hypothetical protein
VINSLEDVIDKIIPIFKEYKILGIKSLDFKDFCKTAEIIKRRDHLKLKRLKDIKLIKSKMNKARYNLNCN